MCPLIEIGESPDLGELGTETVEPGFTAAVGDQGNTPVEEEGFGDNCLLAVDDDEAIFSWWFGTQRSILKIPKNRMLACQWTPDRFFWTAVGELSKTGRVGLPLYTHEQ